MSKRQQLVSDVVTSRDITEVPAPVTETVKPKSIRSLVMGMILAGAPTKVIAAEIAVHFPGTMADVKSTKHIAWYRSRMKKDGLIPKTATPAPLVEVPVVEPTTAS